MASKRTGSSKSGKAGAKKKAAAEPKVDAAAGKRAAKGSALAAERARERERLKAQRKRSTAEGVEKERARVSAGMAQLRATGREVVIPAVADPKRRAKCEADPLVFAREYFPHYMYLELAPYQIELFEDLRQAILYGRFEARAAPRGGGKDTIFAIFTIWALVYGHAYWFVYAGATLALGKKKVENIKFELEENKRLLEDFPEVCAPIRALERSPQRARMQRILNEETGESYFSYIKWGSDEVQFARVQGSVSSGAILTPATVEGSNRGLVRGELRPDMVAINDGETDKAARSETQRQKNEDTIEQTFGGLAGPGKSMAMFILCTIVCPGCIAERFTDRTIKPAWNGKRYRMVESWPAREDLWERYKELWREGKISGEDLDARKAHEFYLENRAAMDGGAVVSWEHRFISKPQSDGSPKEVSAIQHAYNLILEKGEKAFYSEYQNDPLPENENNLGLTPRLVASRVGGYTQGVVPAGAIRITRGIDVGARELHACTVAWMANSDSYVVDYARMPVEAPAGDLRDPNSPARKALEDAVIGALRVLRSEVEDFPMKDTEGNERFVDLTLVDARFLEDTIFRFCREAGPKYRPLRGFGSLQGQKRYAAPLQKGKMKRPLHQCYKSKTAKGQVVIHVNADYWKLFTHLRYLQEPETPGSCSLPGMDPAKHRVFAKHICAESYDAELGKWVQEGPNHFLDANSYANCAGGMLGIRIQALAAAPDRAGVEDGAGAPPAAAREKGPGRPRGRRIILPAPDRARGGARVIKRPW